MSATIMLHGPCRANARLIQSGEFTSTPFVSLDINTKGAGITLVSVDADTLEALSAALGEARVLLAQIAPPADDPPEPDPADAEAQRIAEVFAEARAEQDRGL